MPSEAERELDQHRDLVFKILWARSYARAKGIYDRFATLSPAQRAEYADDPMIQLVQDTEFALVEEERRAHVESHD